MAHGFVSYSKANPSLNLGAMVAGKIKSAAGMAADERKSREEEIKGLKEKEAEGKATAQDINRLNDLEAKDTERKSSIKNSFFAKALGSEFGGDRKRRLQGTFSKNPRASQDPSLTKEQRFSASIDESARPGEEPITPDSGGASDYTDPMDYGDANAQASTPQQSTLEKLLSKVSDSFGLISNRLSALQAEEQKSVSKKAETNSKLNKFSGIFEAIKNYFDKDNELKKQELVVENEKLNNFREQQEDEQSQSEVDAIKATEDLSAQEDNIKADGEGKGGGGLLGKVFKGLKGILGGKKGRKGGIVPQSKAYSSPVGPQPMNSASPWASKGVGERGGMFGGGGFAPRLPATKLSEGGIVTKPTTGTLSPGSSVIPLNRNNAVADTFKKAQQSAGDSSIADPMAQVMQLPSKVGGGLLVGLLSKAMSALGGISSILKPAIQPILTTLVPAFGLPATVASSIFGGQPAAAATNDGFDLDSYFGKKNSKVKKGTGGGSPVVPTGSVSAAPKGNETGILSLSGGTPTALASGSTVANTQLHHGHEDTRGGMKVRDYFIGGSSGPSDGSDGLGARLYTPLGFGPVKYKKTDQYGINFEDPNTGQVVGHYYHVDNAQHQLDGQILQPGTMVGTQGGLQGSHSAAGSTAVHLHVEGTDRFHNAVISTYASGHVLSAPGVHTAATPQNPQPAGARPQLGAGTNPLTAAAGSGSNPTTAITAIPALVKPQTQQKPDVPVGMPSAFPLYDPTGFPSLYGAYRF
jgi:hypothetical protein